MPFGHPVHRRANTVPEKRDILDRLLVLWTEHPDLRLTQLIENARSPDIGTLPDDSAFYHTEDYNFIDALEDFYWMIDTREAVQ